MDKDRLPPIPTPASQRWREFRIQVLPFVVFITVLCAIVYLWRSYVQPVGVVGFAETNMVSVTSLNDGMLTELLVERWQNVKAGQEIAIVANTDPELIKAQLAVAQSDLNLLRTRLKADSDRLTQGQQQITIDILDQRVRRAIAAANLINASSNFVRVEGLVLSKTLSSADLDTAKAQKDSLQAEVTERTKMVDQLQVALDSMTNNVADPGSSLIDAAIDAKTKELDIILKPSVLKAPISGMITMIHHVRGERILRGMPIASISDPETKKIIGYMRQPIVNVPTTGDFVTVTTSSQPRKSGIGKVVSVGAQLEPINPALLSVDTKRMEVGLPILVTVPAGLRLLPGEYVSLTIQPASPKP